jgi:hypothetical protein
MPNVLQLFAAHTIVVSIQLRLVAGIAGVDGRCSSGTRGGTVGEWSTGLALFVGLLLPCSDDGQRLGRSAPYVLQCRGRAAPSLKAIELRGCARLVGKRMSFGDQRLADIGAAEKDLRERAAIAVAASRLERDLATVEQLAQTVLGFERLNQFRFAALWRTK